MNENIDVLNIRPLSSTSSSYSSSSCSSTSSTSSGSKHHKAMNQNSTPIYSQSTSSAQDNSLNLVVNDLKQISCTLSLLARQIDQVVDKIDSNFSAEDQQNLKNLKNFSKIINSNLIDKNGNINRVNSLNRNENIINNYLSLNNQKMLSDRVNYSNCKDSVDVGLWNQRNESSLRSKCTRSKSQPAFKEPAVLAPSSTNTSLNKALDRPLSSPISNKFLNSENGDSSFYEDQLDNELEGIKEINNQSQSTKGNQTSINGIQKTKAKLAGSNHHVSFNINNAIYTSKQETPIPIPISILKQAKLNEQLNSSSSSSNVSPLQSSMKKSPALNFISMPEPDSNSSKRCLQAGRIDKKTTIL